MSSVNWKLPFSKRRLKLSTAARSWVGFDIGSRAIKCVQLQRVRGKLHIGGQWIIPWPDDATISRAELNDGALHQVRSDLSLLHDMFTGTKAAVALSLSNIDLRHLELPPCDPSEQRSLVREELTVDLENDDLQVDFWEVPRSVAEDANNTYFTAVALQRDLAMNVVTDLLDAGWECQILDAVPCAMARAVQLAEHECINDPLLTLDLGAESPLLMICQGGKPLFSRSLHGLGIQRIVKRLQEELKLSADECQLLLTRCGIGISAHQNGITLACTPLNTIVGDCFEQLAEEIERTLAYYTRMYPKLLPQRGWLFGQGATILNLPEFISDRIQLPVKTWRMNTQQDEPNSSSDALYGIAVGLALLAEENC